jgi:hypothetical protein
MERFREKLVHETWMEFKKCFVWKDLGKNWFMKLGWNMTL